MRRDDCVELLQLCSQLSEGDTENREEKISQLSRCFSALISEECQHPQPELSGLLGDLSAPEAETVWRAVSKILSDHQASSVFFKQPLLALLLDILPVDSVPRQAERRLVLMFDQEAVEADQALASLLSLLSSLAPRPALTDGQAIIDSLEVSSFYSLHVLLSLEQERRPSPGPIPLDQITEDSLTEKVNILSNCSSLSGSDVVRYALHISALDPDCALQLLQNFVLELPPSLLLYFCLAASPPSAGQAGDLNFLSLLARAAARHIPGWSEAEWRPLIGPDPAGYCALIGRSCWCASSLMP